MKKNITIVGFGDSITEAAIQMPDEKKRWLNVLKGKLVATFPDVEFKVINAGIGGNSAREAMARFECDVLVHNPDWIVLEFGGNNSDPENPSRRVGLDEFKTLLKRYLAQLPGNTQTLVVTFPPVLDDLHCYASNPAYVESFSKAGGLDKSVDPYREITRDFAHENGFPLFDLYKELKALGKLNGRLTYILPDGVHLTQEGNVVLADGVFMILNKHLNKNSHCQDN